MSNSSTQKEFGLSSWAIDNKMTIYVMIGIFLVIGTIAYFGMPREDFPEVKETKIYVSTVYPGNTAEDIEKLITTPLEDELQNLSNVKEVTSTSQEDYSIITVEFDEDITVEAAKQRVKDEVDTKKAGEDWPTFNDAKVEPNVFDLNLSEEIPIMNINLSGDFPVDKLKEFGEYLEDEIEALPEIKEVSIRGAQEQEVEVAVDIFKMMAARVSFDDVINGIRGGNVTMSAGSLINQGQRRIIRIIGEIDQPADLENFVVKTQDGAVYLKDIATVTFKDEDKTTYAREMGHSVVMLDVKKRAGKNMVEASEKIGAILDKAKKEVFPPDLTITKSNDSSERTINQVDDLVNNIIFGIILVVSVLLFFLGFRNALFVGFAIPMSMFMSFMILNFMGYTLNTMILFGLIMGLGMLVDNGIVVVENVYRLMDEEGMSRSEAAKKGIGEIAIPIIISTGTTVAAFVPLAMWPGMMGEFMKYFPITLSVVLGSSLFVAIFINSMLVSEFMKVEEDKFSMKQLIVLSIVLGIPGILILLSGGAMRGLGSVMIFTAAMFWVHQFALVKISVWFQHKILTAWENFYEKAIHFSLGGRMPMVNVVGMIILFIGSIMIFGMSIGSKRTEIQFFPDNKPNQIITYIEYPQGTDIEKTNKITKEVEERIYGVLNSKEFFEPSGRNYMVESAVSQVGEGAGNPQTDGGSSAEMPHKGKVTVSLREFKYRKGKDSKELMERVQDTLRNIYPGVIVSVEKDAVGPPAGYPVNIEIKGEDYDQLINVAEQMRDFINSRNVAGVDELKIDVNKNKPAMVVEIDREKAGELGVSASMIGSQLRRSIFGEKAGIYKENGEDYDIYVRFNKDDRYNMSALFNQNITFRDPANGQIKQVPVSSVVKYRNTSSFSAIKHNDSERVVTVYSALAPGYNDAGAVVESIKKEMVSGGFKEPKGLKFDYTGQLEEEQKQMTFLMTALLIGLGLIMLLLVFQFSSISKPTIIMVAVFLSFIGVFLGLVATGWPFVIMMTMMGIISLAGIVVNNGVVLLDYTQILIDRKKEELGAPKDFFLPKEYVFAAIVQGGKARLRPVLLTAITTVLGLVPLAIGLNIDFFSLFADFDPKIYMGGDNVIFWGPLAWTVIFGLIFATFLTLIIVPVLFYISMRIKYRVMKNRRFEVKRLEDHEYPIVPVTDPKA